MTHGSRPLRLLTLLGLLLALLPSVNAGAAAPITTINVTTTQDETTNSATCSLREAIVAFNTGAVAKNSGCTAGTAGSGKTITLPAGSYTLSLSGANEDKGLTGDLDVTTSNLTINGAGMGQSVVSAGSGFNDRILQVLSGAQLTLQGLSLSNGKSPGDGGAILNDGTLALTNVEVNGSTATGMGGGIASDGPALSLTSSLVRGNTASIGGGVGVSNTTTTIASSAVVSNIAGPSSINGNQNGGGLYSTQSAVVTVTNTTINQNRAANNGGGIFNNSAMSAVSNSIALTNVTVTGNSAGGNGGGLNNFAGTSLLNTVLAGNSNTGGGSAPDCYNAGGHQVQSLGSNLIGNADGCNISGTTTGNLTGTASAPIDPKLSALGSYGGATPSQRPLQGSPVIDAGTNSGCPAADQRGVQRPADGNGDGTAICDIGAVELSRTVDQSDNTSWPHAKLITAGVPLATDSLDKAGQSRWYKFTVQPNTQITVTLGNLPANYDLTLYKDISASFQASQSISSSQDLAKLSAEFAPDAFSPDAFSPDAFSPDAFSPDAFSPDAFSPDAFSSDVFSPDAFSPDAFSPDAFSPDAFSPDAFSPDAFSPDAFSPDAFSPDAFSPDAFSPDAFSSAQTRSIVGVSAFNGTASEGIRVNSWDNTGSFYARVRGRNGADVPGVPFTIQADELTVGCSAVDWSGVNNLPSVAPAVSASGKQTIILSDFTRMSAQPGNSAVDLTTMQTKLNGFAALSSVNGVVVDVGQDPRVAAANALADATPSCPYLKNVVADSIKRVIDAYRPTNQLKYVVLVGDDDVIPFVRYPDVSLLANEQDYMPPVRDTSASQASLRMGYVLSQDRYGAAINLSYNIGTLPLPQLAVGRLVETMANVSTMLDAYNRATGGVITPSSALVTGYDFLADSAQAVKGQLSNGLGSAGKVDSLITPANVSPQSTQTYANGGPWTGSDLKPLLVNQRHDLVYLAGHFSASSALAADDQTRVLSTDLTSSTTDLTNEILFSAGCHSGYNTVDSADVPGVTPEPDWAQAASGKGVTLIAGTGYQYGDTDFIKYSEQLYQNFAGQLLAGSGPVPIGQALVAAKQQYLGQNAQLTGIDQKAFLEATLFGLPMLSVNMPTGRGGSIQPSIVTSTQPVASNPGSTLGLNYTDVTVNPAANRNSPLTRHDVQLSAVGNSAATNATATYYSGPDGVVSKPFQPVLPLDQENVGLSSNMVIRGAGFRGGSYQDVSNIMPLTGAATSDLRGVHAAFQTSTFYPAQPWSVDYFQQAAGSGPPWLQVTPAQFKQSSPSSTTGTMRVFSGMDFRLFYSGNTTTYPSSGSYPTTGDTPALAAAPAISKVIATRGTDASGNPTINFSVNAEGDPTAGIQTVWITYTMPPAAGGSGTWVSLDLHQSTQDSTRWEGSLPTAGLGGDPANLRFMAQAANGVGLVTLATNLGAYYSLGDAASTGSTPAQLTMALTAGQTSGAYGTMTSVSATLTANGAALAGQTIYFGIGAERYAAVTNASGVATAKLQLLALPGPATVTATFNGTDVYAPSKATAPFTIVKQGTTLTLAPNPATTQYSDPSSLVATLKDASGRALGQRSVLFKVDGTSSIDNSAVHRAVSVITDYAGRAALGPLDLQPGSYTVAANFANVVTLADGTVMTMTDDRYTSSSVSVPLGVTPEYGTVAYTGDTMIAAGTPINLSATVTQQNDGYPADLTKAQVQFAISNSAGTVVQTVAAPVAANGTAATTVTLATADVYSVQISLVGGYFTLDPAFPVPPIYIDNYTPTSSTSTTLVTGGGWINVAAGASPASPNAAGHANFGFNVSQSGKTLKGQLLFNFQAAGLTFKNSDVKSLTAKNGTATFSGSGTLNGATGYTYQVTVVDGGTTGTDSFTIKITKSDGTVVFNTGSGQPLTGNGIVIH